MRPAALLVLCVALCLARPAGAAAPAGDVPTYHGNPARTGHYVTPGMTWRRAGALRRDTAFDGSLSGHVYAQPLFWQPPGAARALLIVATETNIVQALDARTGREVWQRTLGTPARSGDLPCGDISPLGVTGTPVIDPATGTLYLDAMVMRQGRPAHLVFALALSDGAERPGWPVDVAAGLRARGMTFQPALQNERGALSLIGDRLYVPYGGHMGDCGDYHGWVVGISVTRPGVFGAWRTAASKGGIWAPGGLAWDGQALYATTGNTEGATRWGGGEAVLRLPPDLAWQPDARSFFAPANWKALDDADLDMSGTGPLPIDLPGDGAPRALLLALGKDGNAYLLDRDHLGGIAAPLARLPVAESQIITAPATWTDGTAAMVAFQATLARCPGGRTVSGIAALRIAGGAPPSVGVAWCAALDGRGAPVVTTTDGTHDPIVWAVGAEGDERLHGFRGDTGAPLFTGGGAAERMAAVRRFSTILVAGGRLYVAGDGRLYAFTLP